CTNFRKTPRDGPPTSSDAGAWCWMRSRRRRSSKQSPAAPTSWRRTSDRCRCRSSGWRTRAGGKQRPMGNGRRPPKASRCRSGGAMSRILLIVDEFQKFFEATDRIASRARAALDDLARVGRSFGIHVILASQSISSSAGGELESGTLNQFGLRIALTMNESDSRRILSKDNDAAKYL